MNSRLLLNQHCPPGNYPTEKTKCLQKISDFIFSVLASVLFFAFSIIPTQNLHAQCGITPNPALQTSPIDINISTSGTTVSLDFPILSSKGISAAAGPGCSPANLYLYPSHEDGSTPASAFTSFGLVNQPGFAAGSYHFNINGQAFKTEVDAGGWVLIASSKSDAAAGSLSPSNHLTFLSNKILPAAVYTTIPNNITDIRITATSGPNTPFEAFTNNISELTDLSSGRTLSANSGTGNNWTGPSAAFMNKTCPGVNEPLADKIYHACGNITGMHWFPIDGMIKTEFNNTLENDLNLWVKGNTTALLSLPLDFTCGTANPSAVPPTYPTGTYQVVADEDGFVDNTNTSSAIEIKVTITDAGDPTFTTACTAPVGPLTGGAYSTNADGANNNDCRTAISGLMHPGIDDNCSGPILSVVYDNGNDPDNDLTPVIITGATTLATTNLYEFYIGTTTVTYTVTDGTNTANCSFDVIVEDNEDPKFSDPTVALQDGLSDEVRIDYVGPVAGVHSGRARIFLNCNSTYFTADIAFAEAFRPEATDNCGSVNKVTQSADPTASLSCATIATVDNLYSSTTFNYEVQDGNTNDLSVSGNDPFRIIIFLQDDTPPDFNLSTPAVPTPTTTNIDETTAGTALDPYLYSGDRLILGTNEIAGNTACSLDFTDPAVSAATAAALTVNPVDCQVMTFTSSVDDGNGNILTGNTNDVVDVMSIFAVGTYTITYTATDACGQVSKYSFELEIEDNTAPVLDCSGAMASLAGPPLNPTNNIFTANAFSCFANIQYEAPTVMDNCSTSGNPPVLRAAILDIDGNAVPAYGVNTGVGGPPAMHSVDLPVGKWKIEYTLTESPVTASSLMSVCTLDLEVIDITPPTITCGPDQTINSICADITIPDYTGNGLVDDNCTVNPITVTQFPVPGTKLKDINGLTLADGETFTVTLTAKQDGVPSAPIPPLPALPDDVCKFKVTISNNDAPSPTLGTLPAINATTTLEAECGSIMLAPYTAKNCTGDIIIGTPSSADAVIYNVVDPTIVDFYVFNTVAFTTITWTYNDLSNNTSTSQNQIITISDDTTAPIITITNNSITRNTSPGMCVRNQNLTNFLTEVIPSTAPFSDPANQATNRQYIDNCGVVLLEYEVSGATSIARTDFDGASQLEIGSNVITFYATDAAGLTGTNTVEMIVEDNEYPDFTSSNSILLNIGDSNDANATDCAYTVLNGLLVDPTATDNCTMPPTRELVSLVPTQPTIDGATFDPPAVLIPGSLQGYTFNVNNVKTAEFLAQFSFNDGSGQTIFEDITITVEDDRPPLITCPTNTTRGTDGNCRYVVSGTEFDLTAVSDNCTNATNITVLNDKNFGTSLAGETFSPGTTTVTWTVKDLNGKISTCEIDVVVEDNLEPTLNCVNINRNLLSNGTVIVDAFDFLTSIEDACSGTNPADLANFEIKINNQIGQISFDCSDANNTAIEVEISVKDLAGNEAICRPTITIQETVAPTAICASVSRDLSATAPGMVTINASELNNVSTDNCSGNTANLVFSFTPDATNPMTSMDFDCDDTGANPVSFYAIDASGNVSDPCPVTITINDATGVTILTQPVTTRLDANGSVTVQASEFDNGSSDNCGSSNLVFTLRTPGSTTTGTAQVSLGCPRIGANDYELGIDDGTGPVYRDVVLTVLDEIGPNVSLQPQSVKLTEDGTQVISAEMFDDNSMDFCSTDDLTFEFDDGSATRTVDCNDLGTNPIDITVKDAYGNPTTKTAMLTVQPENPVVFTAQNTTGGTGVTLDIDITADNYYEIFSWSFSGNIDPTFATINDITSTLDGPLEKSINATAGEFQLFFFAGIPETIDDGDVVATINVTLNATTPGATTPVELKSGDVPLDIGQGCSDNPQTTVIDDATHLVNGSLTIANGQVSISGVIQNDLGVGIPNVIVDVTGDINTSVTTDANGAYVIDNVPDGSNITLTPVKDTKHRNGVRSIDAAIVQRLAVAGGINNTTIIPSPYLRIAADVANDQNIIIQDAAIIASVGVTLGATFPNVTSWVFVDEAHIFTSDFNPWNAPYNDFITFNNINTNQSGQDFIGIKMGNVIGEADVTELNQPGDTRSADLVLKTVDQSVESGATVSVPISVKSFQDLIALDATLNFDAEALTFNSIEVDGLNQAGSALTDLSQVESGLIALLWYNGFGADIADQEIAFTLNFTANQPIESLVDFLRISDELLTTNAWHSDQEKINIQFEVEVLTNTTIPVDGFELFQNKPNPFRSNTLIGFNLPEATLGTISIYDLSGRLIYNSTNDYSTGYHELSLDRSELSGSGVFIYQFKSDKYNATRKLTILD